MFQTAIEYWWAIVIIWVMIGIVVTRHVEEGWLIMITDPLNTKQNWLAPIGLILCWLLWPICNYVSRTSFFVAMMIDRA